MIGYGMRGRPCFRPTKVLQVGPAPLILVSLGALALWSSDPPLDRRT